MKPISQTSRHSKAAGSKVGGSDRPRMAAKQSKAVKALLKIRSAVDLKPRGGTEEELNIAVRIYKIIKYLMKRKDEQRSFLAGEFWDSEKIKPKANDGKIVHHCVKFVFGKERSDARKISEITGALKRGLENDYNEDELESAIRSAGSVRSYSRGENKSFIEVRVSEKLRRRMRRLARNKKEIPKFIVSVAYTKNGVKLDWASSL